MEAGPKMALYTVVMAGGRGERFWPLSTSKLPKPFIPLLGSNSLLQETVVRMQPLVPLERILISIGKEQEEIARQQLPQVSRPIISSSSRWAATLPRVSVFARSISISVIRMRHCSHCRPITSSATATHI